MLPLNSLCIAKGKAVWVLYVDAICINYDGNAFDAALLAIVAALQNGKVAAPTRARRGTDQEYIVKLPRAKFNEETGKTICSRKELDPLRINRLPISMTFGFFDSYVRTTATCLVLIHPFEDHISSQIHPRLRNHCSTARCLSPWTKIYS